MNDRTALARRIDDALAQIVRVEPPAGLADRIIRRASLPSARRGRVRWLAIPASLALAAACVGIVAVLGTLRPAPHPADLAAIRAWRSPTASLLISSNDVLGTPFTLPRRSSI
jgi:hypothetical protein